MPDLINSTENYKNLGKKITALRVFSGGSPLAGIEWDDMQVAYPSDTVEVYSYYNNAVLQITLTITYSDSTKKILTRVQKG